MVIVKTKGESSLSVRPGVLPIRASQSDGSIPTLRVDVEQTRATGSDPFSFRDGLKTDEELASLRKRKAGKHLERYHRKQNDLIASMLKSMDEHTEEARDKEETARMPVKIAVWASLIGNFFLCILQLYAAITSASLSLITTSVDSVFDFGSNVVLYWLHKRALALDMNKWPVGGSRLETIGNIVYGFMMSAVNLVLVVESVQQFIEHDTGDDTDTFHIPSIVAVGAALGVKFLLFLYCSGLRKQSSQVHVLWEDHRNDLFVNGFGLLMSAGGSKWIWFLDPLGALILAIGILLAWGRTIYKQFELLAGKSAPHDFIQLLIYKVVTFSDEIEKVDTVRAYHSGPSYFVEIDIVMDANTPLWKAHDISQQLQDKIEVLPNVERAFVHVDHETTHAPEHRKNV
ncbi:CDF-like metal transporter [Laetiporus sulphureus 93-53]|uniref:CDF-like metal transporter n=1 Tax=Laetiporus sulphureus 93-53 TaxID=1314785 RepID=A0A165ESP3_9APHY|nr:CDF-like metal transporter [Laetiporus sulphureus 93-53]KZT07677.1 CDF-like metal transporter [Laetiporus sulphureus 93-53]